MKQNNRNNCNMNIQANNFQNVENTLNGNQNTKIMTEDILNSHFLKELSNFNFKNGNIFNCDGIFSIPLIDSPTKTPFFVK